MLAMYFNLLLLPCPEPYTTKLYTLSSRRRYSFADRVVQVLTDLLSNALRRRGSTDEANDVSTTPDPGSGVPRS